MTLHDLTKLGKNSIICLVLTFRESNSQHLTVYRLRSTHRKTLRMWNSWRLANKHICDISKESVVLLLTTYHSLPCSQLSDINNFLVGTKRNDNWPQIHATLQIPVLENLERRFFLVDSSTRHQLSGGNREKWQSTPDTMQPGRSQYEKTWKEAFPMKVLQLGILSSYFSLFLSNLFTFKIILT